MSEAMRKAVSDDEMELSNEAPLGRMKILDVYNTANPRLPRTGKQFNMLKLEAQDGSVYIAFLAFHKLMDDTSSMLGSREIRHERWTYMQVTPERLARLESGEEDLHIAFLTPEKECLWNIVKEDSSLVETWRGAIHRFDVHCDLPPLETFLATDRRGNAHVAGIDEETLLVCRQIRSTVGELVNCHRAQVSYCYEEGY